ncbi:MAG: pilus assembly protein CpaB, partial [Peptostreptococcaceae bacterium]|nr:pilus assembly protein CpaB [Peptostreptococcaceae bacterium]
MKNILRNRTILGIACIALSLIICFGLTPLFNDAIGAKINVVRVTENITKGELITTKMLQTVEVGGFNMPDAVLKNPDSLIGKYAKADLYKGDYVLNTKISEIPLTNYEYLNDFNGTERAISVSIKSFAAGLSGKLEPGDVVSIIVSDFGELKETVNPIELQYVQVLAVTAGTGLDTDEYEKNNEAVEEDKELPSTLTLKVSAEQAKLLAELEVKGKIH